MLESVTAENSEQSGPLVVDDGLFQARLLCPSQVTLVYRLVLVVSVRSAPFSAGLVVFFGVTERRPIAHSGACAVQKKTLFFIFHFFSRFVFDLVSETVYNLSRFGDAFGCARERFGHVCFM